MVIFIFKSTTFCESGMLKSPYSQMILTYRKVKNATLCTLLTHVQEPVQFAHVTLQPVFHILLFVFSYHVFHHLSNNSLIIINCSASCPSSGTSFYITNVSPLIAAVGSWPIKFRPVTMFSLVRASNNSLKRN